MAIRILRRKVIIREYDYKKVADQATGSYYDGTALYDRTSFLPLNEENLEKLKIVELLKGKNGPLTQLDVEQDFSKPRALLHFLKDYLYSDKYILWQVSVDEEGYICVQARKNTPKSRVGWGVFEKDLESRL